MISLEARAADVFADPNAAVLDLLAVRVIQLDSDEPDGRISKKLHGHGL